MASANYICNVEDKALDKFSSQSVLLANLLKKTDIRYPDKTTKTYIEKSCLELWEGLLDPQKEWNILHVLCKDPGGGLRMSPPSATFGEADRTAGNLSLAVKRMNADDGAAAAEWYTNQAGYHQETQLYAILQDTLADQDGTLFQGFRSGNYLNLIIDVEPVGSLDNLSQRWRWLAAMKGVDIKSVRKDNPCKELVKHLKSNLQTYWCLEDKVLDETLKGLNKPPKFLAKVVYILRSSGIENVLESHIRNAFVIQTIRSNGREVDFFGILPGIKALINIEVKAVRSKESGIVPKTKQLRNLFDTGKEQLDDMFTFTCHVFGDLLKDWKYLKILVIPNVDRNALSSLQSDGVLVLGKEDLAEGQWWTSLVESLPPTTPESSNYDRYSETVKRAIGLCRFETDLRSTINERALSVQRSIVGECSEPVTAGAVPADRLVDKELLDSKGVNTNLQTVPECQRRVAAAIMWSEEQARILETFPKKMILENDFGTGKTLLLRCAAKRAAEYELNTVYYISLASVDNRVTTEGKMPFGTPAIIDVVFERQYAEYNIHARNPVHFRDSQMLMQEGGQSVFECLIALVERDSTASFFIDEWQSEAMEIEETTDPINKIFQLANGRVWIVVRNEVAGSWGFHNKVYSFIKDSSVQEAVLPIVMRSAGNITHVLNQYSVANEVKYSVTINDANPLDTVPGFQPKFTISSFSQAKEAFSKAFEVLDVDPSSITRKKNVVVLIDHYGTDFNLRRLVLESLNDYRLTEYFVDQSDEQGKDLSAYLDTYDSILVTDRQSFSGMETKNLIVVFDRDRTVLYRDAVYFRDTCARAVSHLFCIHVMNIIPENDNSDRSIETRMHAKHILTLENAGFKRV